MFASFRFASQLWLCSSEKARNSGSSDVPIAAATRIRGISEIYMVQAAAAKFGPGGIGALNV